MKKLLKDYKIGDRVRIKSAEGFAMKSSGQIVDLWKEGGKHYATLSQVASPDGFITVCVMDADLRE